MYLDPVFSPDGERVAYVSTEPNGHFNLYVRRIRDGAWAGPPIPVSSDRRYRTEPALFRRLGYAYGARLDTRRQEPAGALEPRRATRLR